MESSQPVVLTVILLISGLLGVIWPYKIARFRERLDAIGSKRSWSEVEPAGWLVFLVRIVGALMVITGILGLLDTGVFGTLLLFLAACLLL